MTKLSDTLSDVADRVAAALGLPIAKVFHDPRASELPADDDYYAAIRCELLNGRASTVAFDEFDVRIDIAAYMPDPYVQHSSPSSQVIVVPEQTSSLRRYERLEYLENLRARLTPFSGGVYNTPISGLEYPTVTDAQVQSIDDEPGNSRAEQLLFIGMTLTGVITLPRGGYTG